VSVLVVAEHTGGQVRDITYELITAGHAVEGPLAVAAIGADPGALDLNRAGVDEIVHVRVEAAEFESDIYQQALEALIAERPIATMASVFALGVVIGFMLRRP